jgi:hypothetical protein
MSLYPHHHYRNQLRHRVCILAVDSRSGFALIVALTLMSFILLLVLSLTVFIRVESASASMAQQQLKAKTNALLALNVAIGSLQKHAGVDQVATASADLGGVPEAGRLHWTGVWQDSSPDTAANPLRLPTNPDFLGWLVSAGENDVSAWVDDGEETVTLVNLDGASEVKAPVVIIANDQGAFAWWVGDENRKARLALEDFSPQSGESAVLTFALAQGSGKKISIPELEAMASAINRSSIRSPGSAALATGIPPDTLGPYFHDVSFVSESLLTNARDGGLRMDLTTAFRDDAQFTRLKNLYGEQLFPALGSFDPGGPHWEQLRSYTRLHEAVVGSGSSARVAMRRQTNSQHGLVPVMTRASVWFGMVAAPDPSVVSPDPDSVPEQLRLLLFPSFSFWNPYNIDLEMPAFYVRHTRRGNDDGDTTLGFLVKAHEGHPPWNDDDEGNTGINRTPQSPLFLGVSPRGQHLDFKIPAFTLPAGETRVFSIDGHRPYNPDDADQNELVMGWYPGMGFYLDSGFPYDRENQPRMTLQVWGTAATHGWFVSTQKPQPGIQNAFIQVAGVHAQQNNLGIRYYSDLERASSGAPYPVDNERVIGGGITTLLRLAENSFPSLDTPNSLQWLGNNNPRAAYISALREPNVFGIGNPVTYTSRLLNDKENFNFDVSGDSTFIGHSNISGRTQVTLFDVPRAEDEIVSLGQLMHANLGNHRDQTGFSPSFSGRRINYTESYRPAYVIGNASPQFLIEGSGILREGFGDPPFNEYSFVYDYPWLVNHALWDRVFFSTLPSTWTQSNLLNGDKLPSRRVKVADSSTTRIEDLKDSSRAAATLTLEGGFNVNSTSEDAWALFLGSLGGEVPINMSGSNPSLAADTTTIFVRMNRSAHNGFRAFDSYNRGSAAAYGGFRELSATEIRNLASAIVAELKARRGVRGPFISLAKFVNRSRQEDATTVESYRGLLQRAINNSGINDAFLGNIHLIRGPVFAPDGEIEPNFRNTMNPFPLDFDTQSGSILADIPGYLTQMDILARLGHLLTVRADTFTIRVMGESASAGNAAGSRAYLEAVVRRSVEFVEPFADPASPDTPEKALTTLHPINRQFGRRFEIVDLRWLSEDML